ncbi:MAG: Por secretion system C-terminal sorting protein, partial [Bacteroidota bacterium]|nr:Por secretion system C-terminal sorting protein [Bacteroidota bacterium]
RMSSTASANATMPTAFAYGSMGGYLTYAEVVAKLDELRTLYPDLISVKQSIGKSTEGRDLWVVKISNNPDNDENKPKVFYNALTHAREPAGMMQMIYYMCYILQNYNTNPEIKHLVDNRELYFEPVVNPDGYEYNRSLSATGGGMWRKNRYAVTTTTTTVKNCVATTRKVCDTTWKTTKTFTTTNCVSTTVRKCDTTWKTPTTYTVKGCQNITTKTCDTIWKYTTTYTTSGCHNVTTTKCDTTRTNSRNIVGVDLNRNYGYQWGFDNTGSSNATSSDTYRGPYAFSEPEIAAIRDFSILKQFKEVSNQHTFANALTYAYSYKDGVVIPDQALYMLKNQLISEDNHFLIGHMLQTCGYLANGEASDWQYGEQTLKPKAYSWSPELGGSSDGFWPPQSRIEPLCLTMIKMNTNIAWIAGEYYRYSAPANLNATSTNFSVPVTIINYGDPAGTVEKIKFFADDNTDTGTDSVSLDGIVPGMTASRNLTLDLSAYQGTGTVSGVLRIYYPDGYTQDQPFSFTYSLPSALSSSSTARRIAPAAASSFNKSYELFPNPMNDILYYTSPDAETPASISVYDMNGSLMRQAINQAKVDLSDLSKGMYQVVIETANGRVTNKIIKQ